MVVIISERNVVSMSSDNDGKTTRNVVTQVVLAGSFALSTASCDLSTSKEDVDLTRLTENAELVPWTQEKYDYISNMEVGIEEAPCPENSKDTCWNIVINTPAPAPK